MRKQYTLLQQREFDNQITVENNSEFLYQLQHALLLALRARTRLSPMQLRHAEEKLRKQRRDRAKQKQEVS